MPELPLRRLNLKCSNEKMFLFRCEQTNKQNYKLACASGCFEKIKKLMSLLSKCIFALTLAILEEIRRHA